MVILHVILDNDANFSVVLVQIALFGSPPPLLSNDKIQRAIFSSNYPPPPVSHLRSKLSLFCKLILNKDSGFCIVSVQIALFGCNSQFLLQIIKTSLCSFRPKLWLLDADLYLSIVLVQIAQFGPNSPPHAVAGTTITPSPSSE